VRRVRVEIDRLVLRGVLPHDRRDIAAGLTAALERALAEAARGGAFARGGSTTALDLGQLRVANGLPADTLGRLAGDQLAKGISS
jgi:hypothetical protein